MAVEFRPAGPAALVLPLNDGKLTVSAPDGAEFGRIRVSIPVRPRGPVIRGGLGGGALPAVRGAGLGPFAAAGPHEGAAATGGPAVEPWGFSGT